MARSTPPHRRHGRTCSAAPYFLALTRSRRRQVAPASSARTQATSRPQLAGGATVPPVLGGGSPVTVPPVLGTPFPLPPVLGGGSPVTVPPVLGIPFPLPPVLGGGSPKVRHGGRKAYPPPPSPPTPTPSPPSDTCPMDALKLGACVDLLGNEVHIGDANVQCCPLVKGVAGLSAAACLCTAIKAKVLDLSVYVPIALEVLVNCGCAVPPGYTCA
ncbi:36.4 kDa proline-rich protein-like [Phragmites australis]|uniref:36.4 kDa proline-rich protein-like n=1 Tax=Phragmites australis TaxID=29695 RepID=UPI002D79970C|nr:36.4 kDa proline-rich protein-like [Phragmites australis]